MTALQAASIRAPSPLGSCLHGKPEASPRQATKMTMKLSRAMAGFPWEGAATAATHRAAWLTVSRFGTPVKK